MRPLALLSVGLVFLTAAVVAVVAHATVPGLGWAEAAVLGAILAPTDAVAAISIFRRIGAPERVRLLVEGESMINDGTALVLYRIAVGVATGGAFSLGDAALEFVAVSAGGIAVGLAVGFLSTSSSAARPTPAWSIVLTVLTAYGAYIGAEELHVSGILAAVVAGLYGGYQSPRALDADTRLSAVAFWNVLIFGLEMTLFVLLGLQLPEIVDTLEASSSGVGELLWPVAAIAAASIATRLAFVFAMRSRRRRNPGRTLRGRLERDARRRLPGRGAGGLAHVAGRPQIIFLTFALILVTLVGQGLSLPFVDPRAAAGGAAALERRRGGGADGGGAGGARPDRRDRGRGARRRVAAEAPARPLPRPLPDVPGGARRRGPGDASPASSGSPTTASLRRELIGVEREDPARPARRRTPAQRDDAPDRARPRPRGGADPLLTVRVFGRIAPRRRDARRRTRGRGRRPARGARRR